MPVDEEYLHWKAQGNGSDIYIRWVNVTPIFDKYEQNNSRQAAIDSSMPGEFNKWN